MTLSYDVPLHAEEEMNKTKSQNKHQINLWETIQEKKKRKKKRKKGLKEKCEFGNLGIVRYLEVTFIKLVQSLQVHLKRQNISYLVLTTRLSSQYGLFMIEIGYQS